MVQEDIATTRHLVASGKLCPLIFPVTPKSTERVQWCPEGSMRQRCFPPATATSGKEVGRVRQLAAVSLLACLFALPRAAAAGPSILDTAVATAMADCYSGGVVPQGVTCQNSVPVSLNLSNTVVGGTIPESISTLTSLTAIDLSSCGLSGSTPGGIGSLTNLQYLDLSVNTAMNGTIPASMSALTGLTWLNLESQRSLTGPFPSWLGVLSRLQTLALAQTNLTGTIPGALSRLQSLEILDLGYMYQLSGSIPSSLSALSNLAFFRVSGAELGGGIPRSLSGLSSLQLLALTNSWLTGSIPSELGALTKLSYLSLFSNQLTGPIPGALGALANLQTLLLHSNQLTSTIPSELGRVRSLLMLNLKGNQLWGTVPASLTGLTELSNLDVSSNFLSGELPLPLGAEFADLNFDNNYFWGTASTAPCKDPGFSADRNCLSSSFPCSVNNRDPGQCATFCGTGVGVNSAPPCAGKGTCVPSPHRRNPPYLCVGCTNGTDASFWEQPQNQSCGIQPPPAPPAPPPTTQAPSASLGLIVGLVVAGVAAGAAVAGLVAWRCTRSRSRQRQLHGNLSDVEEAGLQGLHRFKLAELRAATNDFSEENKLGEGSFGEVFLGVLPPSDKLLPNKQVAVKRQVVDKQRWSSAAMAKSFLNEARVLSGAHHLNLVALRGCCCEDGQLLLVFDYVPNGTVKELIRKDREMAELPEGEKEFVLTWERRVQLALGSAKGLNYLHSEVKPEIVHLDFKSDNVLVDDGFVAKVADFGVSKVSLEGGTDGVGTLQTANYRGTPGYIDPFFYADPSLTKKSDVYSFGVVLLELATGWAPLEKEVEAHILHRVLAEVNSGGFATVAAAPIREQWRPSLPPLAEEQETSSCVADLLDGRPGLETSRTSLHAACSSAQGSHSRSAGKVSLALFKRFVCLALWCCSFNRSTRPTMEQVVRILSSIAQGHAEMGEEACILDEGGLVDEQVYSFVASRRGSISQGSTLRTLGTMTLTTRGAGDTPGP